jgi:polyhydroxyalkanoate synthesis regulator phasin
MYVQTIKQKGSTMLELIKKGLMASIGAVVLTTEKVQEAVRKLVEEGKISTEEGEKLAEELVKSGERQWDEISAKMSEKTKKWSEGLEVIKRKEFEDLKNRVETLEQRLDEIAQGRSPKADA